MKKILRLAGLVLATAVTAIFGFILIGGLIEGLTEPLTWESWGMGLLSSLAVLSAVLSWFRLRIGAWMTLGTGAMFTAFALVTAGQRHLLAVASSGFPLLLAGGLMLLSLRISKETS